MSRLHLIKTSIFLSAIALMASDSYGVLEGSIKGARKYLPNGEKIFLSIYNSEDYIAEDDSTTEEEEPDIVSMFEDYCKTEYDTDVDVIYSTFDTNETMLAQLDLGKTFDLVCPSDYVIQKMIAKDMIVPFDDGSTPNYDKYVSPFVYNKIANIEVNGQKDIVNNYARGYMWGTLSILYNDNYGMLGLKGITAKEMNEDMNSWLGLWDEKYDNLLAIKDSMRDTYAAGIFKLYNDDFEDENGTMQDGLATLKNKYDNKEITEEVYNEKLTDVFNKCDDKTIAGVEKELKALRANSFGFEVDSGKVDMAQGNKFAINLAWSGDAAWAMDMADEYNEQHIDEETGEYVEGFNPTTLKYIIPETGANIWFDGWVMPKSVSETNKIWAERFVDFLSMPKIAAINMDFIGYTPVIAGDDILSLVLSNYDLRWDEEKEELDDSLLDDYEIRERSEIPELSFLEDGSKNPDIDNYAYAKDISYFFADGEKNTLEEHPIKDTTFYLPGSQYARQFDSQYPDASLLPTLAVMEDFGNQNIKIVTMWERARSNSLPIWAYVLIVLLIVLIIGLFIFEKIRVHAVHKRRKERKKAREAKLKASIEASKKQKA